MIVYMEKNIFKCEDINMTAHNPRQHREISGSPSYVVIDEAVLSVYTYLSVNNTLHFYMFLILFIFYFMYQYKYKYKFFSRKGISKLAFRHYYLFIFKYFKY